MAPDGARGETGHRLPAAAPTEGGGDGAGGARLGAALAEAAALLAAEGICSPRLEARMILAHVLGREPSRLLLYPPSFPLADGQLTAFHHLLELRIRRMPIQYVLGRCEFYSLPFKVQPGVLIPRPETELLVDEMIARLDEIAGGTAAAGDGGARGEDGAAAAGAGAGRPILAADIGTGSGAVAVAAAVSRPGIFVYATDISRRALAIAAVNAAARGVDRRLRLLRGSWCRPLAEKGLLRSFHAIASNPPYITADEMEDLQPEVKDYEPSRALFTGGDGLGPYRELAAGCMELLVPGGSLLLEVADRRAGAVARLLASSGWEEIVIKKDLARRPRVVMARAPGIIV